MIRHIFWDWNGTLADDAALLYQAVNTAMAAIGHPRVSAEQLRVQFARPLSALFGRLTDERCHDEWPAWHAAFIAAHSETQPVLLMRKSALGALCGRAGNAAWGANPLAAVVTGLELSA